MYMYYVYRARGPLWAHVGPIMEAYLHLPEVYSKRSLSLSLLSNKVIQLSDTD
jgi:hypothetical protein